MNCHLTYDEVQMRWSDPSFLLYRIALVASFAGAVGEAAGDGQTEHVILAADALSLLEAVEYATNYSALCLHYAQRAPSAVRQKSDLRLMRKNWSSPTPNRQGGSNLVATGWGRYYHRRLGKSTDPWWRPGDR